MDKAARRFVKASLVWLCVGVTLGVAIGVRPSWTIYRPAHLHTLLLGFVTMMIFGVGYHVLPRFVGRALHSRAAAAFHLWVANVGLAAMTIGFVLRVSSSISPAAGGITLGVGGGLSAIGAFTFAWNIWKSMDSPPRVPRASGAALPVVETAPSA